MLLPFSHAAVGVGYKNGRHVLAEKAVLNYADNFVDFGFHFGCVWRRLPQKVKNQVAVVCNYWAGFFYALAQCACCTELFKSLYNRHARFGDNLNRQRKNSAD